ncbi:unnamed protein product, partial [Amoebophrya sp. A120]
QRNIADTLQKTATDRSNDGGPVEDGKSQSKLGGPPGAVVASSSTAHLEQETNQLAESGDEQDEAADEPVRLTLPDNVASQHAWSLETTKNAHSFLLQNEEWPDFLEKLHSVSFPPVAATPTTVQDPHEKTLLVTDDAAEQEHEDEDASRSSSDSASVLYLALALQKLAGRLEAGVGVTQSSSKKTGRRSTPAPSKFIPFQLRSIITEAVKRHVVHRTPIAVVSLAGEESTTEPPLTTWTTWKKPTFCESVRSVLHKQQKFIVEQESETFGKEQHALLGCAH